MGLFSGGTGFSLPSSSSISKAYGVLSGKGGYEEAADRVKFQPFNIRTGLGSANWSGNTGTFALSPEYQSIRDSVLGGAKGFFSQANTFDPNAASANAYGLMQGIAAPQRERDIANLRSSLFGMGRLGAADATGGNPELRAYYEAQNQSDLMAQLQSIGIGQSLLDSLIGRGTNLLGVGKGLDESGNNLFALGLKGGEGTLGETKAQGEMIAKGGAAESSFWNNLLFGKSSTGVTGGPGGTSGIFG